MSAATAAGAPSTPPPIATPVAAGARKGEEEDQRWQPLLDLACQVTVEIPLARFRVSDFLKLKPGSVVIAHWRLTRDVPLRVNGTLIGWGELEAAGSRMAIRLTELA